MSAERLRQQLYDQIKNRALMYWHIYSQMRQEIGEERATVIMSRAIYNRGVEIGRPLKKFAPDDLRGLKEAFVKELVPDEGRMFAPEVVHCSQDRLEIRMRQCPLKDALRQEGLSEEDVVKMLHIASRVDCGTFEGAGFRIEAHSWKSGRTGCCRLVIRPGESSSAHGD